MADMHKPPTLETCREKAAELYRMFADVTISTSQTNEMMQLAEIFAGVGCIVMDIDKIMVKRKGQTAARLEK